MKRTSIHLLHALSISSLCVAGSAEAYSDQDRFAEAPQKGGGGGRYFTGSPADGFGCSVCHQGGAAPKVQVLGLPKNFVPGTTYDLELSWDNPALAHAVNLELVTDQGVAGGTLALPAEGAISARERCDGQLDGDIAAKIYTEGARQVLSFADCGASLLRVRWTAPQATEVTFAAGLVRSDASAKPEGDGVTEQSRTMLAEGVSRTTEGGCGIASAQSRSALWAWFLALSLLVSRGRRRSPR